MEGGLNAFTKEHYVEIAKVLKNLIVPATNIGLNYRFKIVQDFVELFRKNPRFNVDNFLHAIYGKEDKT